MIFLYHIKIVLLRIGKKMNDANLAMIDTQTDSIQYINFIKNGFNSILDSKIDFWKLNSIVSE